VLLVVAFLEDEAHLIRGGGTTEQQLKNRLLFFGQDLGGLLLNKSATLIPYKYQYFCVRELSLDSERTTHNGLFCH
jgi:hypothetical protein